MADPPRIGLTGGIASGKSTVADMFADLGAVVIDTDVIAREVVMPGEPALDEIVAAFGNDIVDDAGMLKRGDLREIVFSNEAARKRLEAIIHPRIRSAAIQRAEAANGPYQLIVVPLLFESPLKEAVDRVLVVDCTEETQIRRLMARDAASETEARQMLAAQASRAERLSIADDVISNDKSVANTRQQVIALHEIYLSLA
ncbi:MAG: dephospho-CoA kinase [Woeseiaceae bacterium]|nr:dephospho-CoA kinase [Woeseiaceae bacterium]NIP21197.1 dephospho-CoA kinase [Woeseiaceae bacterium]NIS90169.1 dephospho-CoA kinase [Woeseiaceae bacterium]